MTFTERKEWHYDPDVFSRMDVQTALNIHAEYVKAHSPRPRVTWFEVDRSSSQVDDLWHVSLSERTKFTRTFEMPAIARYERPDWRLTKIGLTPSQKLKLWCSNRALQEADYFPQRGDIVFYNGYRHIITKVVLEPEAYWQQTNVWLGLICEATIPPQGDARPQPDVSVAVPSEVSPSVPKTLKPDAEFDRPKPIRVLPEL